QVSPVACLIVDETDENLPADVTVQVNDDAAEVLLIDPARTVHHLVVPLVHQFDASVEGSPAAAEERRPGVRDLEGDGGEFAARPIAIFLVAANPEVSLVLAAHIAAAGVDGIALDWLADKGVAFDRSVLEGAGLEIEVERPAVV